MNEEMIRNFVAQVRNTRDRLEHDARRVRKARASTSSVSSKEWYSGQLTATRYAISLLNVDLSGVSRIRTKTAANADKVKAL